MAPGQRELSMFRLGRFPGFTLKSAFPFLTKETVAWRELLFIGRASQ